MTNTALGQPLDEPRLRTLFTLAGRGDQRAFGDAYDELASASYAACATYLEDADARDDAMRQFWLLAWRTSDLISRSAIPIHEAIIRTALRFARERAERLTAAA